MKKHLKKFIFFPYFIILLVLHGCAAAVVTTGATGLTVAHDRRTTGTFIEDQSIELKANQAFYTDDEINNNAHVNVTSYNMIVLVTGEAPTQELIQRIINIVENIPKVSHVYNELTLAAPSSWPSRSSDSLTLDNFDGTRVKVVTEKGIVYLMGLITRNESDRATEAVRTTSGVQKVVKLFQYLD